MEGGDGSRRQSRAGLRHQQESVWHRELRGAEASCRLLAERMSQRGHESAYFTHRVLPDHAAAAAANAVALRGLQSRNSVARWRSARPWRTAASLTPHFVHHRVDIAYCFYEPNILRSLFMARRLAPRVRVVMQMAGQHWYESSLRNPRNVRRYARLFAQVDCVNYVDAKLEEVTRQRLESWGSRIRSDTRSRARSAPRPRPGSVGWPAPNHVMASHSGS